MNAFVITFQLKNCQDHSWFIDVLHSGLAVMCIRQISMLWYWTDCSKDPHALFSTVALYMVQKHHILCINNCRRCTSFSVNRPYLRWWGARTVGTVASFHVQLVHHPFAVHVFSRISIARRSKNINIRLTGDFNLLPGPSSQWVTDWCPVQGVFLPCLCAFCSRLQGPRLGKS